MCHNDDLPGPDWDPDAWNDEDKQASTDPGKEFQDDDNYKVDDDGLA